MAAFRIFIADDHEVVRKGLCALLQADPNLQICGEAADGREAVDKVRELKPDAVILDIGMPGLNGLEATRQIMKDDPRAKVLILTFHDSDQVVRDVLNAGARGFLLKSDAARDLVVAVEALRRDKTYFTSKVAAMVLDGYLKGRHAGSRSFAGSRPAYSPRTRSRSVTRGRQEHQGSGSRTGTERENSRNPPLEYHAQAATAFGERSGAVRGAQQYRASFAVHARIDSHPADKQ